MIRHIPNYLKPKEDSQELMKIFKRSFNESILNVSIIGNYDELMKIGKKWMKSESFHS